MKNKKWFCFILALTLVFSMYACSKSGGSATTANAQSNTQVENTGIEIAQSGNTQVYYSGKMNQRDISEEMQKVSSDFQAGNIGQDEYVQRLTELSEKMTGDTGIETTASETSDNANKIVDGKYQGNYLSVKSYFTYSANDIPLNPNILISFEHNRATFNDVPNGGVEPSFLGGIWTEGNSLMCETAFYDEKTSTLSPRVVKIGTFTDVNTFIFESNTKVDQVIIPHIISLRGENTTEKLTFKRQ